MDTLAQPSRWRCASPFTSPPSLLLSLPRRGVVYVLYTWVLSGTRVKRILAVGVLHSTFFKAGEYWREGGREIEKSGEEGHG